MHDRDDIPMQRTDDIAVSNHLRIEVEDLGMVKTLGELLPFPGLSVSVPERTRHLWAVRAWNFGRMGLDASGHSPHECTFEREWDGDADSLRAEIRRDSLRDINDYRAGD